MSRVRQGDVLGNPWGITGIVDRDLSAQPSGPVALAAGDVSAALVNGAVAWELVFSPTSAMWLQQEGGTLCLCEATTSAGSLTLQYEAGRWFIRLGGVALLEVLDPEDGANGLNRNNLSQTALSGDYMRVVWGYWPAANLLFLQVCNNGCASFLATNRAGVCGVNPASSAPLVALTSISAITVGSRIDATLPLGAQWKRFRAFNPAQLSGAAPEQVLIIGDSVESALSYSPGGSACAATASHIYTPTEAVAFTYPKIRNQAIGGATIVTQKATFLAGVAAGLYPNLKVAILGPGINDANQGSATMATDYASLVAAVRPYVSKVVARLVTPCLGFLGATNWARVVALNTALQNGSIAGIDLVETSHYAQLAGASGNLLAQYDSGDHVHPLDAGRAIIGAAHRSSLSALGYL